MNGLRERREALGLTLEDVAERVGTTRGHISSIELGRVTTPKAELRRKLAKVLGIRHVDLLMMTGELEDWEIPGFSPTAEPDDPTRSALHTLLDQVDLARDQRGTTLGVVLQSWAAQDSLRTGHPGRRNGTL